METKAEVWLPLSQGKVAVIDFDDFEKVRGMKWCVHKNKRNFYAARMSPRENGKQTSIYLHRVLTNCPPDKEVNHINGDGLNCKQENMQICTGAQNISSFQRKGKNATSKYRGVCWHAQRNRWHAQIRQSGKTLHLGYFDIEENAARAYDVKAIELFGIHAAPNFPREVQNA